MQKETSQSLLFNLFLFIKSLYEVRGTKAKAQRLDLPSATPLFSAGTSV